MIVSRPLLSLILILGFCSQTSAIAEENLATVLSSKSVAKRDVPIIKIVVLGSGTPIPSATQAGTAILVEAAGERFLFDCGRGCTTKLAQYDPQLIAKIDKLFLTHLHSDHVVGIPDLWLNGWTQGRLTPLRIWGPTGTDAMMEGMRTTYAADIGYRVPSSMEEPKALARETHIISEDRVVYTHNGATITAFRVRHADIPAYGYRIDYDGKSVLLSGDTSATPNLTNYGKGADIALLEVASPPMVDYVQRTFPPEQAKKILALHLTADQAAEAFATIKPQLGVFYHMESNCAADSALIAETRNRYDGQLTISRDLMEIDVMRDTIQTSAPDGGVVCGSK